MTFLFRLRLLAWLWVPDSSLHILGQEPWWSLRWLQVDQKTGCSCPSFWMALGHPGPSHLFVLPLLPMMLFALAFPVLSWLCSLPLPPISSFSFPFFESPKCMLGRICRMGREKAGVDGNILILQVTNSRFWVHDEDWDKVRCKERIKKIRRRRKVIAKIIRIPMIIFWSQLVFQCERLQSH